MTWGYAGASSDEQVNFHTPTGCCKALILFNKLHCSVRFVHITELGLKLFILLFPHISYWVTLTFLQ